LLIATRASSLALRLFVGRRGYLQLDGRRRLPERRAENGRHDYVANHDRREAPCSGEVQVRHLAKLGGSELDSELAHAQERNVVLARQRRDERIETPHRVGRKLGTQRFGLRQFDQDQLDSRRPAALHDAPQGAHLRSTHHISSST